MTLQRFKSNPIIFPELEPSIGHNINGPSLIQAPEWLKKPLGRYYLYFAHHQGKFIRLAYADQLEGPWTIYGPGTLHLDQTPCYQHIASPDVHIDDENQRLIMYYHGPTLDEEQLKQDPPAHQFPVVGGQRSLVAFSSDGVHFTSGTEIFGPSYFRVFRWDGYVYALGMPGILFRSRDGLTGFERGPKLFTNDMRHAALMLSGTTLHVFYSIVGDCPEHIVRSQIELTPDWMTWKESPPVPVAWPETDYEGGNLTVEPSSRGAIHQRVKQLRDPAIYTEGDRTYLLYSVAGENGIAIAELTEEA